MTHMIENPESYFRSFIPQREALLKKLEAEAAREEIPIIGPVAAELLYILARTSGAKSILELGTATGYSGIYLAKAAVENGGRLITLEWSSQMASRARENFKKAGVSDFVEIRVGDALEQIENIPEVFDFIFLDIDKEFYIDAIPILHSCAKKGCLLVADNVGFKDSKPFNRAIAESDQWKCVHLFTFLPGHSPENDGLCFALAL